MFERDFLLSVRLNYLHLKFLAGFVQMKSLTNASTDLLSIAEEILGLVVEGILQRDQLANAGSGVVWKVGGSTSNSSHETLAK
jgi:hypothetical protein